MAFASRKSRMRASLDRRTAEVGACLADPFANGEGAERIATFTIPSGAQAAGVSTLALDLGRGRLGVNQVRCSRAFDRHAKAQADELRSCAASTPTGTLHVASLPRRRVMLGKSETSGKVQT